MLHINPWPYCSVADGAGFGSPVKLDMCMRDILQLCLTYIACVSLIWNKHDGPFLFAIAGLAETRNARLLLKEILKSAVSYGHGKHFKFNSLLSVNISKCHNQFTINSECSLSQPLTVNLPNQVIRDDLKHLDIYHNIYHKVYKLIISLHFS